MLARYDKRMVDRIALTPHFYPQRDRLDAFLERREKAFSQLCAAVDDACPKLHLGAEVAYFDGFRHSKELVHFILSGSNLLLVELPMHHWDEKMFENILFAAERRGFTPVLAHLDRYRIKNATWELIHHYLQNGGLIQVNTSCLKGRQLKKSRQWILQGKVHFVGSDCHNLTDRAPDLCDTFAQLEKDGEAELLANLYRRADRYFPNIS